jgi:hypothetical protein
MWLASFAQALVLMIPAAEPGTAWVSSGPNVPKSIATRQTLFSIPFQIPPHSEPGHEATEVQLFASANRGARWDLYSRTDPAKGSFLFRAAGDGEYWFLIRTLDRTGELRPQHNNTPGLVVVVDTVPPVLQLDASRGEAGQITAKWQLTEPNLSLDTLRLQYRTSTSQSWQPVAIDRKSINSSSPAQSGEVTWWPRVGSGRVEIRAEASDTAGNATVTHAQVNLDSGPVAYPAPHGNPVAQGASVPASPDASAPPAWHNTPATSPAGSSVAMQVNPPIRNQFVATAPSGPSLTAPPHESQAAPPGKRPRMVNTRLFELDYNLDSQSTATVRRIELWGTADGGKTWSSFGTDDDGRSPMVVTVNQEGTYGFRITVETAPGLAKGKPRPGDQPEIWIGVDLTKPTGQIVSVEQGSGDKNGQWTFRWQAADQMLTAKPIALFYGENPSGPWYPIAALMENSGQYVWSPDDRVPPRVYLRLEVRDEAGNVGAFDWLKPIELSRPQPTARIRDIRPLNDSARVPPKRYYLYK